MGKRVAVVLAGCGNTDGSEITEAVGVLVALSEGGADVRCFAPDVSFSVVDVRTGEPTGESRNVLAEAARIARGRIEDLTRLRVEEFDAVVFPGGLGAAVNLSSWRTAGAQGQVRPEVARVIREFHAGQRPIAAICVAPALVALTLGRHGVTVTLGTDSAVAAEVEKTGALHEPCAVDDFITDRDHRIVTTPAYMHADATPFQVFTGIRRALGELLEMA